MLKPESSINGDALSSDSRSNDEDKKKIEWVASVRKMMQNDKFKKGYQSGKKEVIDAINQAVKVFWEVWKNSATFKSIVMKDIYNALNKKRPEMLSEVVVTSYEHRGPSPIIHDIKHLTPLLCQH